jgi:glycosyltransferase involved in cell wall biosynthesis
MISVVSGTYNRLPLLSKMVESARASVPVGIPLHFVLVDGGSTDGTIAWCLAQSDVTLIQDSALLGAVSAFTRGAYAVPPQTRAVILSNDDVVFRGDSILKALLYLDTHPTCGAVAFADNRPFLPTKTINDFQVMGMMARRRGKDVAVHYAQVGMFRRWLGDKCGWWGANDPNFNARTYGGDNYLSSRVWELGYTVDAVKGVEVEDMVHEDGLRQIGRDIGNADSEQYFARFPFGADIPEAPLIPQQEGERLRILYLPVYEPGHAIQKISKRGLRDALAKIAWVYEFDFLQYGGEILYAEIAKIIEQFKPHMMLSQIQAPEPMNANIVQRIRAINPNMVWVNWNGDYAPGGLTSPAMLNILKWVDLQLVVNGSVLDTYKQQGIAAAYWQIGYEEPGEDLPEAEYHDVVFLANAYTEGRKALENVLYGVFRETTVGLYGSGWDNSKGTNLYDFATGKAIYRNAKIAIGDNQFPDAYGFVSNRLFQALAAGGCLLLHQYVPGLDELTGLQAGVHYIVWHKESDLRRQIKYYLKEEDERRRIADAGTAFVREHHSFDARVKELHDLLKSSSKRRPREIITLNYVGARKLPFGVMGQQYTPGDPLRLPADDAAQLLRQPELWKKVESEF